MINKFYTNRTSIYTLLLYVVLFTFLISFALNAISVFLLLAFFFIDKKNAIKKKLQSARTNRLVLLCAMFFLIQCMGLLYTTNLEFGLKRVTVMLPILFLPLIVITEKLNLTLFDKLLNFLVIWVIGLLVVYLFIHLYIDERQFENFVLYYLNDKLGISQFYISFIIIIPLLKLVDDFEAKKRGKFLIITKSLFLLFFAMLLGNITIFLFLSILIVFKIINGFKERKKLFKLGVLCAVFGLIGLGAFFTPRINEKITVLFKTTDFNYEVIKTKHSVTHAKNTLEQRVILNMSSLNIIMDSFPFGVGTGDFKDRLLEEYKKINFKSGIKQQYNNHNQYMSEFTKTGVWGGICFIVIIISLLKKVTFSSRYFSYLVILFALGCLVESYLFRQHGVLIFSFIIPLFFSYENQSLSQKE